jgi:hypothetical protein
LREEVLARLSVAWFIGHDEQQLLQDGAENGGALGKLQSCDT